MKTIFFAALVILTISSVNGQVNPTCDDSTGISPSDCEEYIAEGAITVTFDGRTNMLNEGETDLFKAVIANVSNKYVLLEVTPEHVTIVQRVRNTVSGDFGFVFFILNPSGSTIMPVALRRQELYLMVKLNNNEINTYLMMDVTAQAPPSSYPLAIPAWAIAIIGYVGLIIFIYCIMVLTSDWRQKMSAEFEASLEKEYYENTNGVSVAKEIPLKKMPVNGNQPDGNDYEVVMETKSNGAPKYKEMGVQTPRHVAVQVDPEDVMLSQSSPAPSQASTTEVVIENGHPEVGEEHQYDTPDAPDTAHIIPMTTESDAADKEADEAAAAIEGAVNEGFAADESDVTQPSTNL